MPNVVRAPEGASLKQIEIITAGFLGMVFGQDSILSIEKPDSISVSLLGPIDMRLEVPNGFHLDVVKKDGSEEEAKWVGDDGDPKSIEPLLFDQLNPLRVDTLKVRFGKIDNFVILEGIQPVLRREATGHYPSMHLDDPGLLRGYDVTAHRSS